MADYVAARRLECNQGGSPISPSTVNKEIRHLRAIIRKAFRWGWLFKLPEFDFLKEPGKLPTYVIPEHFDLIYRHCDEAREPSGLLYPAGEWWRSFLVMAYMTGWRVGSLLALRWEDVNLEKGTALSRYEDNKGKRDALVPLHPVVVDHLRRLPSFSPLVFPWALSRRSLYNVFRGLQDEAG